MTNATMSEVAPHSLLHSPRIGDADSSGRGAEPSAKLVDRFGRKITYLRVSVTDRCDLRCVYCMAENMTFLPKKELLSLEELERLCGAFIRRGVRKLRLTGGEPLVRKNIMQLFTALSEHLQSGTLDELTLTTNGSQLGKYAHELAALGVRRVNVSLDTLKPDVYREVTRWGDINEVLTGLDKAQSAGLRVKLNVVALKGINEFELEDIILFAHNRGADVTFIEVMPLGDIGANRADQYLPLSLVRSRLMKSFTLVDIPYKSGGPARYAAVGETGHRIGFITPLTHNFCELCNRVRITCTGTLYTCLGRDNGIDLRGPMRASADDDLLDSAIDLAIAQKSQGHDFVIDRHAARPAVARHMNVTGG